MTAFTDSWDVRALWVACACVLVLSGLPDGALAETRGEAAPRLTWSLEKAERAALERSPRVRRALAALDVAHAYRAHGKVPRVGNPRLDVRAMIGQPHAPAATYGLFLGVPFDISGRRPSYRREASWLEQQAAAELAAARNWARAEAREAFVEVVFGEAAERVALANAEIADDFLERVKARFAVGAATALDVALSERENAESQAEVSRVRRALARARGRFRQALNLSPMAYVETEPLPPPRLPAGLTAERAVKLAVERRAEATAFRLGAERLRAADERLRREAIAPLMFAGEYEAQGNQNTRSTVGASLGVELPVMQKNQGPRATVRAQAEQSALEAELIARTVAREALVAYESLELALRELSALEEQALPAAERSLSMTEEMLKEGAVDYFRLLTARRSAFAIRAQRVEAMKRAWLFRIALERAMGGRVEEAS